MKLKKAARSLLVQAAGHSRLIDLVERRHASTGVTVLMYHRVLPDDVASAYPLRSLAMPVSAFKQQVAWLAEHRKVLPLKEAIVEATANPSSRGLVSITFDDGYTDNAEIAAPILDAAGVKATFYITAGLVGTDQMLWFDRAAQAWKKRSQGPFFSPGFTGENISDWMQFLKAAAPEERAKILQSAGAGEGEACYDPAYRLMSLDQMCDLHARGHEIGSHTLSHPLLPQLSDAQLHDELARSRQMLSQYLGDNSVEGIAYPNGDADPRVVRAAIDAGYRYAVVTRPGQFVATGTDRMLIPRLDMNPNRVSSGQLAFRAQCCQLFGRWT